ncbi:adenine deaminase [Hugenholtzia roseola]|uniref:adenine deaminase n=1 Tax=Hugenholtzia roseola TaxID=1002 RepID=UPI000426AAAA|nr:adenine deaminase [Hugenholtzia roseola]
MTTIRTNLVNIAEKRIYPVEILIENGKIAALKPLEKEARVAHFALSGFIDAHVHIESSMLVPSSFAPLALAQGTVATVSDPHEIANVLGIKGVLFMIENAKQTPLKFYFGAPSCVPATPFETAGATLGVEEVAQLLALPEVLYLAEMMNFPAVIARQPEVMAKIEQAHRLGKPVDGHAPALRGADLKKYIEAGIYTDHEAFTEEEAAEKLALGMKILIREGSAAKNFEALIGLLDAHYPNMMFCSDDKHPDDLALGHINQLVSRAVKKGLDLFKVLQVACLNPIAHYGLSVGGLEVGKAADFIIVEDLENFEVLQTYIEGNLVYDKAQKETFLNAKPLEKEVVSQLNSFKARKRKAEDFAFPIPKWVRRLQVIEVLDGELITRSLVYKMKKIRQMTGLKNGDNFEAILFEDILKIVVLNRYVEDAPIAIGYVKNFGLKKGAIASTVAHDSHNLIAVGTSDESLAEVINLLIETQGGIAAVSPFEKPQVLPLPIAGLMSDKDGLSVAQAYTQIDTYAKNLCHPPLRAPFMTLSFMALLVIPYLKMSDKGLFDGQKFDFTKVFQ